MKRVNIQNDVESRNKISASVTKQTSSINPVTTIEDAKSQGDHGEADMQECILPVPSQKRGRKTKGDTEEIPV